MFGYYIREIRKLKHIKQYNLLPNKSKSKSAKVEKDNVSFTIDLLKEICTNLGLTLEEFLHITEFNNKEENLLYLYRLCLKYLDNQENKQEFLKEYKKIVSKPKELLTINESRLLFSIKSTLSLFWEEIPSATKKETNDLYKELLRQDFYSQYDYMALCNGAYLFSYKQLKDLVKKTYPVYLNQRRNHDTKLYANTFMLNVIDMCITYKEYKKALFYADMLIRHTDLSKDYFIQINVQYLKHICCGFLNHDKQEFDKAYSLLDTLRHIGSQNAADQLQHSLDEHLKSPELKSWKTTHIKLDNLD